MNLKKSFDICPTGFEIFIHFALLGTTGEEKHADGIFRIQGSPSIKDTLMNLQVNPQVHDLH